MQKVRQAAPDGARARSASALKNSRFFEKAVAEATLNFEDDGLVHRFSALLTSVNGDKT